MSYKLEIPYTNKQKADFVFKYERNKNLKIEKTETALYALEAWEKLEGDEVIDNTEQYEQEQAEKEAERVNMLTMTALDFITFLQEAGLTLEQINAYLETNLAVKMQLTYCQNVFCGVAKSFMPVTIGDLTITADMVEEAFKIKNKYEGNFENSNN